MTFHKVSGIFEKRLDFLSYYAHLLRPLFTYGVPWENTRSDIYIKIAAKHVTSGIQQILVIARDFYFFVCRIVIVRYDIL